MPHAEPTPIASSELPSNSIAEDIAAGQGFISLSKARRDHRLQIDGRTRDLAWIYRAISRGVRGAAGNRIPLEFTIMSGVRVTTDGCIRRFVARQMQSCTTAPPPSQSQIDRAHADTESRLAGAGL